MLCVYSEVNKNFWIKIICIRSKFDFSVIFINNYIPVNQMFRNILEIYLLYTSNYDQSSLEFKVDGIVWHYLKQLFCQFFLSYDDTSFCILSQRSASLNLLPFLSYWNIAKAKIKPGIGTIIRESSIRTICWIGHQFDSLKFLKFIPEINTYAGIAKLLYYVVKVS